ncbi:hypothetical protein L2E82_17837 [Cichorium intybus]|uniref:Uncharacterized protein n=1 Tax=Cichorium intybus TaxID=13427 RepID=A0ACB9FA94_CICIN|nr:hypothetical protein L2E82_17837 [Cichorium intybus]
MGCCISKCKSKRKRLDVNPNSIEDKLVISQSPPPPSRPPKRRNVQSPPSTTPASLTLSSASSSLSSASSSSSVGFCKVERSFSNDFLQSCAKENHQIVVLDPNKNIRQLQQLVPGSKQKRARASSPTLTRQKSIRVEKEISPNTYLNGRSTMRSPSPSRRFSGLASNHQRPLVLYTTNAYSESRCLVKANSRPPSPNRNVISKERTMYPKNKEKHGYVIGSNVGGVGVGEVSSMVNYSGPVAMTDIDNSHVALDCFIFL